MPGLASIVMSATRKPRSSTKQEPHEDNRLQALFKQESIPNDNDNLMGDGDEEEDEDSYRPRPHLPRPQVNLRSLADLMRGLEDGSIDVDPEYQREVVWTADRMTGLVNSLMENFYIPPIILNGKQTCIIEGGRSGTRTTYVCVDGKQRLSSVRAFIKGMIPCHDHRGEKWWFSDEEGRRRKILPDATQKAFLNKDFIAYQFQGLSQEQEEDLFARVQMGMTLTPAEKMRASSGPWQELARLFVVDFPVVYGLMKDKARAKDFQLTLSCFSQIVEVMHPTAATGIPILKTNHTALPKFVSNKGLVDDGIKSHLANVWNTLKELIGSDPDTFTNANKYLGGVQTFAPVEMVAVTIMISMYSETRNNRLLLGDIRALREEIRKHFVDLRLNAATWKFIWEYLDELEVIRGAVDGSTVDRRHINLTPGPSSIAAPMATTSLSSSAAAAAVVSTQAKSSASKSGPAIGRPATISGASPASLKASTKKTASRQIISVDMDPGAATLSAETHSPKRQRTDPGPSSSNFGHINESVGSHQFSRGGVASLDFQNITPSSSPRIRSPVGSEQSLFVPEPAARNTAVLPQIYHPKAPVQQGARNAQETRAPSNQHLQQLPQKTPLPLPSEVRQELVSQLHNYHTSSSTHPTYRHLYSTDTSPQMPSRAISSTQLSSSQSAHQLKVSRPQFMIGIGAYKPANIHEQWEGIARSISPQSAIQVVPPPSSALPQTQKKRKHITRSMPPHSRETIDLTSDSEFDQEQERVERERQNLLSSFKGKSTAGKHSHGTAAPTIAPPRATLNRFSIVGAEAALEDSYAVVNNNPYAKYKNRGGGNS